MKKFIVTILIFVGTVVFAQAPTAGLINHWPFSGNANDIVGSNNGTVMNATLTSDRFGNPGCAYSFNGINSYIITLNAGPTGTLSRSVSFWAKTTNTTLTSAFCYGSAPGSFSIQFFYGCPGTGPDCGTAQFIRPVSNIANGNWHHFVYVYDNTTGTQLGNIQIYMDGTLLSGSCSGTPSAPLNSSASFPINFGKVSDNNIRYFKGDLDDFYIYNRALTPTEVLSLFNDTPCLATPPSPGTISGNITICQGASAVYSVAPVAGATSYTWSLPGGWTGTSTTNTILVTAGPTSGQVAVSAGNCCGGSQPTTLDVTSSICSGISAMNNISDETKIIPNPNKGNFTITTTVSKATMEIYNNIGQMVYSRSLEKNEEKVETKLPAGVYFVILQKENKIINKQKLIINQ